MLRWSHSPFCEPSEASRGVFKWHSNQRLFEVDTLSEAVHFVGMEAESRKVCLNVNCLFVHSSIYTFVLLTQMWHLMLKHARRSQSQDKFKLIYQFQFPWILIIDGKCCWGSSNRFIYLAKSFIFFFWVAAKSIFTTKKDKKHLMLDTNLNFYANVFFYSQYYLLINTTFALWCVLKMLHGLQDIKFKLLN